MIDIFTHARWCNHCSNHVDLNKHHETCEYAAIKKEVEELREKTRKMHVCIINLASEKIDLLKEAKELREKNSRMRELLIEAYTPTSWCDNG